ncbi:hypothetical protein CN354_21555 [Bacillus cereus]|nr:hypothetical protein CN354_21555 [Bacillus cereus]
MDGYLLKEHKEVITQHEAYKIVRSSSLFSSLVEGAPFRRLKLYCIRKLVRNHISNVMRKLRGKGVHKRLSSFFV